MRVAMLVTVVLGSTSCDGPADPRIEAVATIEVPSSQTRLVPNEEVRIAVVAKEANGDVIAAPTLQWSTSDASVATVAAGVVKGIAPGTATINVSSGAVQRSFDVAVDQGGFVGPAGATLTAFDGGITLVVPAGALSTGTAIRLGAIAATPADPTFVRGSGGLVDFTGMFAQPARLTLSYNAANGPIGLPESRLGVRVIANGQWMPV